MNSVLQLRLPKANGAEIAETFAASVAGSVGRALGRSHAIVMMVIFTGALVVGYLLLPGINERIAMLAQDGHNIKARGLLEQRFNAGDRSQRTLFQLQRLYEHAGDIANAGRMLEMLAEQRPKDPQIQRELARFYKQTQNETAYLAALERQIAARYSEPACKELIGLYRGRGDFADEQRTIDRCRQSGYRRTDDLIRLAYLVAVDGRLADASALLRSVDERRRLKADRDRRLFFTAMIEEGRPEEAQRRALRWLKGAKDNAFALDLIDGLVAEKHDELAIALAREVGAPGDAVSLSIAELLLDRNQDVAARTYLRGWFEATRLAEVDLAHRFIAAALDADDPELAYRGGEKFGLPRLGQRELVMLAEALSAVNQRVLFEEVRKVIDPQILKDNPLLAAAIEVERGANEPARQLLSRVQVDGLDEWRLALWARLMETTGRRALPPTARAPAAARPAAAEPTAGPPARNLKRLKDAREKRAQQRRQRERARQQGPVPVPGTTPQ